MSTKRTREEASFADPSAIVKLDDIDHVLTAADMYVNQQLRTMSPPVSRFVFQRQTQRMEYMQDIVYPFGLLKIFDEALVNACDNTAKLTNPCTKIAVRVDPATGRITVSFLPNMIAATMLKLRPINRNWLFSIANLLRTIRSVKKPWGARMDWVSKWHRSCRKNHS